jgi:hypothetical protein
MRRYVSRGDPLLTGAPPSFACGVDVGATAWALGVCGLGAGVSDSSAEAGLGVGVGVDEGITVKGISPVRGWPSEETTR